MSPLTPRDVFMAIMRRPGIRPGELPAVAGWNPEYCQSALRVLEARGWIVRTGAIPIEAHRHRHRKPLRRERSREILALIRRDWHKGDNLTHVTIAERLNLRPGSVNTYMQELREKGYIYPARAIVPTPHGLDAWKTAKVPIGTNPGWL